MTKDQERDAHILLTAIENEMDYVLCVRLKEGATAQQTNMEGIELAKMLEQFARKARRDAE